MDKLNSPYFGHHTEDRSEHVYDVLDRMSVDTLADSTVSRVAFTPIPSDLDATLFDVEHSIQRGDTKVTIPYFKPSIEQSQEMFSQKIENLKMDIVDYQAKIFKKQEPKQEPIVEPSKTE